LKKILYISYDGLTDHLGQSQVIPYLHKLAVSDLQVQIISFEKTENFRRNKSCLDSLLKDSNIIWHPLNYTKYPLILSTMIDLLKGFHFAYSLHRLNRYSLIHCRSQVPALIGLVMKKLTNIRFIFDMRGWWVEEKLDSGHWNNLIYGPVVRLLKWVEKLSFKSCDQMIVLTRASEKFLVKMYPDLKNKLTVIPTCTDVSSFGEFDVLARHQTRSLLGIPENARVMVYSGSFGGNYALNTLMNVFTIFLKLFPHGHIIILSKTDPRLISERIDFLKTSQAKIHIFKVNYSEVNKYLSAGDVGLVSYTESWSNMGRSPTKLAEYWLCGLPVIAQRNVGDLEMLKSHYPCSLQLFDETSNESIERSFGQLTFNENKTELRKAAIDYFGIRKGVDLYKKVYSKITDHNLSHQYGNINQDFRNELKKEGEGPHLVVFDVCNTLYYSNTTLDFIDYLFRKTKTHFRLFVFLLMNKRVSAIFWLLMIVEKFAIKNIIRNLSVALLRGISREQIYDFGKRFVEEYLPAKIIPQVHDMLNQAIGEKAAVCLMSDSLDPVVRPVAENFGVDCMAEELEFDEGYSTGRLKSFVTKLSRIDEIRRDAPYKRLTVISDNKSDRNLLEIADKGYAVIHKKRDKSFWQRSPKLHQIWMG